MEETMIQKNVELGTPKSAAKLSDDRDNGNALKKQRPFMAKGGRFTHFGSPLHPETEPGDLLRGDLGMEIFFGNATYTFTGFTILPRGPQHAVLNLTGSTGDTFSVILEEEVLFHAVPLEPGLYNYFQSKHDPSPTWVLRLSPPEELAGRGEFKFKQFLDGFDFLLRQYCTMIPYDQNHDPGPNDPNCCGRNLEKCGLCAACCVTCGADLCGGGATLCGYCCKQTPCYQPLASPGQVSTGQQNCVAGCRSCMISPLICTHSLTSLVMLPVRAIGMLAGHCIEGKQEGFNGPSTGCMKHMEDFVGGGGNAVTRVLKAQFFGYRHMVKSFGHCYVDLIKFHAGLDSADHARKAVSCAGYPVDIAYNLYYISGLDCFAGASAVAIEVIDQIMNRDLYSEGPVLLQGWLKWRGGKLSLPCAQFSRVVWVVIRPWSVTVYENPSHMVCHMIIQIPTSNMAEAVLRDARVDDTHVELRTLDSMFLRFKKVAQEDLPPEGDDGVSIEVWAAKMREAAVRVENMEEYDQGVKHINRIIRDDSAHGPFTGVWRVLRQSGVNALVEQIHLGQGKTGASAAVTINNYCCIGDKSTWRYLIVQTAKSVSLRSTFTELQLERNPVPALSIQSTQSPHSIHGEAFFGFLDFLVRAYMQDGELVIHRSHKNGCQVMEIFTLVPDDGDVRSGNRPLNHPCGMKSEDVALKVRYEIITSERAMQGDTMPRRVAEIHCVLEDPSVRRLTDDVYCTFHGNRLGNSRVQPNSEEPESGLRPSTSSASPNPLWKGKEPGSATVAPGLVDEPAGLAAIHSGQAATFARTLSTKACVPPVSDGRDAEKAMPAVTPPATETMMAGSISQ